MKRILLLFFIFVAMNAKAGDTLTRAQVYNFSVGDTFDYRTHFIKYYGGYDHSYPDSEFSITYSRYVITQVFYSPDSSTKYIQEERLFPLPDLFDTITLQNLSGYEVDLDAVNCTINAPATIFIDSISQYHGRVTNTILQSLCMPAGEILGFGNGLGMVLNYQFSGGCGPCYDEIFDSTMLIYYAKGNEVWGTPFSDFATELQSNVADNFIQQFPTLNDGNFCVETTDGNLLPINLMIYDITGKKMEQILLTNTYSDISIEFKSRGVYVWKALTSNQLIQTGKMVVY